ncbi:MAG: HAMP domain-containing protein, partial [bacterium]|nr:HAMP domain-containing protein [bacterium]
MKFSIQVAVILIVGLLFLASLISVYFALGSQQTMPLTLVASANIVAVILLTFLITRGIMQPLRHIREIMKQVGGGNLNKRIELKATKEMEEVGEAFNNMIFKLHNARKEIEDANKILERRVTERTQQ